MATPTISSQIITQAVSALPVGMGLQVSFQLVGVTAGSVALLVPTNLNPQVHVTWEWAVVDSNLQVTFEFYHRSLTQIPMPSTYKFLIISGI
jgi:hypothetical protein